MVGTSDAIPFPGLAEAGAEARVSAAGAIQRDTSPVRIVTPRSEPGSISIQIYKSVGKVIPADTRPIILR